MTQTVLIKYDYATYYDGTAEIPTELWEELQTNDDWYLSYGDREGSIEIWDDANNKVVFTNAGDRHRFFSDCPHGVSFTKIADPHKTSQKEVA